MIYKFKFSTKFKARKNFLINFTANYIFLIKQCIFLIFKNIFQENFKIYKIKTYQRIKLSTRFCILYSCKTSKFEDTFKNSSNNLQIH